MEALVLLSWPKPTYFYHKVSSIGPTEKTEVLKIPGTKIRMSGQAKQHHEKAKQHHLLHLSNIPFNYCDFYNVLNLHQCSLVIFLIFITLSIHLISRICDVSEKCSLKQFLEYNFLFVSCSDQINSSIRSIKH